MKQSKILPLKVVFGIMIDFNVNWTICDLEVTSPTEPGPKCRVTRVIMTWWDYGDPHSLVQPSDQAMARTGNELRLLSARAVRKLPEGLLCVFVWSFGDYSLVLDGQTGC